MQVEQRHANLVRKIYSTQAGHGTLMALVWPKSTFFGGYFHLNYIIDIMPDKQSQSNCFHYLFDQAGGSIGKTEQTRPFPSNQFLSGREE
jgi:hypothetical protein